MLPSFELYFCMLADSWTPWLAENRRTVKFEAIIGLTGSSIHDSNEIFFRTILQTFKKLRIAIPENAERELELFAGIRAVALSKKIVRVALNQQVSSLRERFYQILIFRSLAALADWLDLFFAQIDGTEINA